MKINISERMLNNEKFKVARTSTTNKIKRVMALSLIPMLLIIGVQRVIYLRQSCDCHYIKNSMEYQDEIKKFDEEAQEYANYVNSLNLDDLQIIMKVTNDIWNSTEGYKRPEHFVFGYERLSFMLDGYGVCTSFSDTLTTILNMINKEYNAENMTVYLSGPTTEGNGKSNIRNRIDGNHEVTKVDIPGKDLSLILDPTNKMIGLLKNGRIYILNDEIKNNKLHYAPMDIVFSTEDKFLVYVKNNLDDFNTNVSLEEAKEIYGSKAQQKALASVNNTQNNNRHK